MNFNPFTPIIAESRMPKDEAVKRIPARLSLMLMRGFFLLLFLLFFKDIPVKNVDLINPLVTAVISMASAALGYNLKSLMDNTKDRTEE